MRARDAIGRRAAVIVPTLIGATTLVFVVIAVVIANDVASADLSARYATKRHARAIENIARVRDKSKAPDYVYSAYQGLAYPTTTTIKARAGSAIETKFTLQDVYTFGVETRATVKMTYRSGVKYTFRKYRTPGTRRMRYRTFRQVFGRRAFPVNVEMGIDYTMGVFDPDVINADSLNFWVTRHNVKLRPNHAVLLTFPITMDQCHPWPQPTTPDELNYLKAVTGFAAQPADLPCLPARLGFGFEESREVSIRGQVTPRYAPRGFGLLQVPIVGAPVTP